MGAQYIPADRQNRIANLIARSGVVNVAELSELLGVSEITIRRDLAVLEQKGILERTHGGAIQTSRMRTEPLYAQKDQEHQLEKEAIGVAASRLIEEEDTVLINSGSTTHRVLQHIRLKNIRVITSNVGAFSAAADSRFELILIGGVYRPQSNSVVGSLATLSLGQVFGSKAIIGVDGISVKYGLTTPNLHEAEVARTMIERTRGPVIIVADHTKLGVVSNFVTAPIEKVHILVTDRGIDAGFRSEIESIGIRVIIAS